MRCQKHHHRLSYKQFYSVAPCTECSNPTQYQSDILCLDCSNGFGECSLCRANLNKTTEKRLKAAFRSPEAVSIRKARIQARRDFETKRSAVNADLSSDCAAPAALLDKQLAPHRLACAKACQPFRDKLDALNEDLAAEQQSTQLSARQMASVSDYLRIAHEKCDEQCEPHLDKYEREIRALVAAYRKKTSSYAETARQRHIKLQSELDIQLRRLENEMSTLLYRSTRVRFIVLTTIQKFVQKWRRD